eukprot:COSAG02_NODE_500_length_21069_cov_21.971865_11_plen_1056_part_00
MFVKTAGAATLPVNLPDDSTADEPAFDPSRELCDPSPARKLAALDEVIARITQGKQVAHAIKPIVRGCLDACDVADVRASAYRALRSMHDGAAHSWAAALPNIAADIADAPPKVRLAAIRTFNAIPAAQLEDALGAAGPALLSAAACDQRHASSSTVRRAAIETFGFLLLDQLSPEAAARSQHQELLNNIWTAVSDKLLDSNPAVCLASVEIVRRLFLNARSSGSNNLWFPLAAFVRTSLQPRRELLLNRLCSVDVQNRASCIVPLFHLVLPIDALASFEESKKLNGIGNINAALVREVVAQHFLPQLDALAVGLVHEVAKAVLAIVQLVGWGSGETASWARAACTALLRVACRQDPDVLETCATEVSEVLHLLGRQYELPYALELMKVARRLPDVEVRSKVLLRLLRVVFERAVVQPAGEPSVVRLLLEDAWVHELLNGDVTDQSRSPAAQYREEVVLCSTEAMLLLAQTTTCGRFRGSGGAAISPRAWLEPALILAEALSDCLWWQCGVNETIATAHRAAHRVGAQLSCLRLIAKLCHIHHRVQGAVIHDGVPHRRLQQLLEKLKAGYYSSDTPSQGEISAEPIRLRVLWLLAQHLSLRDERETTAEEAGPSDESLVGMIRHRLLRIHEEMGYIRWLENAATRGVVGSDGAMESAARVSAEQGEGVLILRCLHFVGLRSLNHARLCIHVIEEFEDSGRAGVLALLQMDAIKRQLTFALTQGEGYDWLLSTDQQHHERMQIAGTDRAITTSSQLDAYYFPDVDALGRSPAPADIAYDRLLEKVTSTWRSVPTAFGLLVSAASGIFHGGDLSYSAKDKSSDTGCEPLVRMTVISGSSDPLYVEAGHDCTDDGGGTALSVHICAWNRTQSLVAWCRIVAESSAGLHYLGDDALADLAHAYSSTGQRANAAAATPARAIRCMPPLPPGQRFRCVLPYSVLTFARHTLRIRFILADEPTDRQLQPRRDHLAISCAPITLSLWQLFCERPPVLNLAQFLAQWSRMSCVYVCVGWLAHGATLDSLCKAISARPFRVVAARQSGADAAQCQLVRPQDSTIA